MKKIMTTFLSLMLVTGTSVQAGPNNNISDQATKRNKIVKKEIKVDQRKYVIVHSVSKDNFVKFMICPWKDHPFIGKYPMACKEIYEGEKINANDFEEFIPMATKRKEMSRHVAERFFMASSGLTVLLVAGGLTLVLTGAAIPTLIFAGSSVVTSAITNIMTKLAYNFERDAQEKIDIAVLMDTSGLTDTEVRTIFFQTKEEASDFIKEISDLLNIKKVYTADMISDMFNEESSAFDMQQLNLN